MFWVVLFEAESIQQYLQWDILWWHVVRDDLPHSNWHCRCKLGKLFCQSVISCSIHADARKDQVLQQVAGYRSAVVREALLSLPLFLGTDCEISSFARPRRSANNGVHILKSSVVLLRVLFEGTRIVLIGIRACL